MVFHLILGILYEFPDVSKGVNHRVLLHSARYYALWSRGEIIFSFNKRMPLKVSALMVLLQIGNVSRLSLGAEYIPSVLLPVVGVTTHMT